MNKDSRPEEIGSGEFVDGLNIRVGSSKDQNDSGIVETLQGEVEVEITGLAIYYGSAIGGSFVYSGYEEVRIGNQVWMKKNWDANYPGSKVYDDLETNRAIYGGLYTHDQILQPDFCPAGYHIPMEADVDELITYLSGSGVAGGKMKEVGLDHWLTPNTGADDSSGFKALPGGGKDFEVYYGMAIGAEFVYDLLGENCLLWLADDAPDPTIVTDVDGNEYHYKTIGSQQWMLENLKTTKYADGTAIPSINVTGGELLTSWTNFAGGPGFDVFTSVGKDITLAINPDSGTGECYTNIIASPPPGLRLTIDLTVNNGSVPALRTEYDKGGTRYYTDLSVLVNGANTVDWVVPIGATNVNFQLLNLLVIEPPPYANVNCDFSAICSVKNVLLWQNDTSGLYCWYNNDIANKTPYGALYNWYAVDNAHGIAPTGWRIPTQADWIKLIAEIGGAPIGGKLKELGTTHWATPNTGAENYGGFLALPGGDRNYSTSLFEKILEDCNFWASTAYNASRAYRVNLNYNTALLVNDYNGYKSYGFSVRCVRDIPA